jgi:hypothetical protein
VGLAHTGWTIAKADVTVLLAGVAELHELEVFITVDE